MLSNSSSLTRKDAAFLTVLVLVALGIRLYFLQFYDVISADGISYVAIAKDFISGRGLASATHYPPFFPILLGLASLVTDNFETAGLVVSVFMGSLLAIPVYLLGTEFFDRRVGAIGAFLAVTWPTLRFWSTAVMSQATYITLLLFGIYFLWRAYKHSAWIPSVLSGVFFACAHLTRSEGVLVFAASLGTLLLFTFLNRLPLNKLLYLLISAVTFMVVFSPYMVVLHDLTGKWQLTGKSKVAIADALSEYLRQPDIKHDPRFTELGYLDLFRLYPEYIRTNYLKNLATCWREMLPLYGWLLAFAGIVIGSPFRQKIVERVYLLASFAPLVVIVVFFFIGPEYTQPYLPVLFLFIGNSLCAIADLVLRAVPAGRVVVPAGCLRYLPVVLAFLHGTASVVQAVPADRGTPYHFSRDGGRFDDKRIGLKLDKVLPASAVLMTRSGRIGFYSERPYLTPPQADYAGIVEYAKKNKADFLIATAQLLRVRPQLEFLYDPILHPERPFSPPPELELVAVSQEPGGLPYLVFRFK